MASKSDKRGPITLPNLLICEGPDDVSFFQALLSAHHNLPHFSVRDTSHIKGQGAGNSRFSNALIGLRVDEESFRTVERILIVADNDEDPAASFRNVQKQINTAFGDKSAPSNVLEWAQVTPNIRLKVLMIPRANEQGNLETLCKPVAEAADLTAAAHIDALANAARVDHWPNLMRRNEMWLRCNIAIRCKTNPFVFLGNVFREHKLLIPLGGNQFRHITDVLATFT